MCVCITYFIYLKRKKKHFLIRIYHVLHFNEILFDMLYIFLSDDIIILVATSLCQRFELLSTCMWKSSVQNHVEITNDVKTVLFKRNVNHIKLKCLQLLPMYE